MTKMPLLHHLSHRLHPRFLRRHHRSYATKFTGRVVIESENGRNLAVEIDTPMTPSDVRGYSLPRRDLICKSLKILHSNNFPNFDSLSEYLKTLTLTPSEASEILKSLKPPSLALQFFRFCPSHLPTFRHDVFTYNRILHILSKSSLLNRRDIVLQIVDEMERAGTVGSISTINILIGVFGEESCRGGGVAELERCLGFVKKWGLNLNNYTYKCLLQAYLRLGESSKGVKVYREMKRRGYKLDIFAYNVFLDALVKDEKVEQAYMVFEDMKKEHCEPDEYTYTIMIKMAGKSGEPDKALSLFQEMLSKGCSPNLIAFNTMLEVLAKGRMIDKAVFLFSKMVENNCRPNEFTYSILLNLLVEEGKLGRLDEIVKISSEYMNKSIYSYLVRTLGKLGHANEAHRLFCNMWSFHDRGDRDACLSMLESLCNARKTVEAIDLLSNLHKKGIKTDTYMYNLVFSSLGKYKQITHIHDLYERMKKDGPPPDIYTYNILISSFGRSGRVEDAVKIFEELESSDCKPDIVSYNSLINCLGKCGNVDEAHMRFMEMQEKGFNPDVVTYSTLIECFGKSEKVEMARRLFDEMLAEGCSPNIVTYNILLGCLEKSGRTAEAVELYSKLKQQGLTPDYITYATLESLQRGSNKAGRVRRKNPITGWVVSPLR